MVDLLHSILQYPKRKSETISVRLPCDLIQEIEVVCNDSSVNLNRNNLIKLLIEASLKELQTRLVSVGSPREETKSMADGNLPVRNRAAQILYNKEDLSADQNSAFNKTIGMVLGFKELDGRKWNAEQKESAIVYCEGNVEKIKASIAEIMKENRKARNAISLCQ